MTLQETLRPWHPRHWMERAIGARAVILVYHRIAEAGSDPWALAVSPQRFAEQLQVIRRAWLPLPLLRLARGLREGTLPEGAVVLTFDDGYADNLHHALPLLERHELPATVFVASGATDSPREFWWDELGRLLLQPGLLPRELRLSLRGSEYVWELDDSANLAPAAALRYQTWRAAEPPPTPRHALYLALWRLLREASLAEREEALARLREWAGAGPEGRETHRALTAEELARLAGSELVEIGAHTVNHPLLPGLPLEEQRREILTGRARLQELLERPVASFAYPFGRHSAEAPGILREAGFTCACTTRRAGVRRATDPCLLPRIQVEDWDGERFAREIGRWLRVRSG